MRPATCARRLREGREGNLVLFVVDASGSMAARRRMSAVKGAVLSLLLDAYQRRDKVGLVTFRGSGADLVLPPTSSVEAAAARLADAAHRRPHTARGRAARAPAELLARERLRDPRRRPLLVARHRRPATGGRERRSARPGGGLLAAQRRGQRGGRLRVRSGTARARRRAGRLSGCGASVLSALEHLAAATAGAGSVPTYCGEAA